MLEMATRMTIWNDRGMLDQDTQRLKMRPVRADSNRHLYGSCVESSFYSREYRMSIRERGSSDMKWPSSVRAWGEGGASVLESRLWPGTFSGTGRSHEHAMTGDLRWCGLQDGLSRLAGVWAHT